MRGRPKKYLAKKSILLPLEESFYRLLKGHCLENSKPITEFIKEVLKKALEEEK